MQDLKKLKKIMKCVQTGFAVRLGEGGGSCRVVGVGGRGGGGGAAKGGG